MTLPKPPMPPDIDLRDFRWMPLDVIQLDNSDTWTAANGWEAKACINLWCRAWHQVPAGSLPDDDALLAAWAKVPDWPAVREKALHGFTPHSDGRLYHKVICAKALEAYTAKKTSFSQHSEAGKRGAKARWGHKKRLDGKANSDANSDVIAPPIAPHMAKHGNQRGEERTRESLPQSLPPGKETTSPRARYEAREGGFLEHGEQNFLKPSNPENIPLENMVDPTEPDPVKWAKVREVGDQVLILAGVQPETWVGDLRVVDGWLQAGADPEQDIYPTVERLVADNPNFTPPRSAGALRYFSRAIEEARENRLDPVGPGNGVDPDYARWGYRCAGWFKRAFWVVEWGPKPGEPHCQAPPELVEKYGGAKS